MINDFLQEQAMWLHISILLDVLRMYLGQNLTVLSPCITQMNCYPQRSPRPCLVLNNSGHSLLQTSAACTSRPHLLSPRRFKGVIYYIGP